MLLIEQLTFAYGDGDADLVLDGITASFAKAKISVLAGPSGCGKTTILNLIAGILVPARGKITSLEQRAGTGYVFQSPSLAPWRTVLGNALLGAEIRGTADDRAIERARELVQLYGLNGYENRFPSSLSGGMQQRVAIIRAIIAGAKVLLLDEPFFDSDFRMRRELQQDLSRAVDEEGLTAILVTHDLEEAVQIGDRIIVLTPRPARVAADIEIPISRRARFQHKWALDPELFPYLQEVWAAMETYSHGMKSTTSAGTP